jgi:hypothetical protein
VTDRRIDELNNWLRRHKGVVTRPRLITMGFGSSSITQMLSSGRLTPMMSGTYVSAATEVGRAQVLTAVCQRYPQAAIGFTTAGSEWGYRNMVDPLIHVLAPHAMTPEIPGVVVHRCRRIDPVDVAFARRDGVRLTSPPRTLFDCAALLDPDTCASAIEQAMAERRCSMDTLFSTMARLRHHRRPGSSRFEAVLLSRPVLRGAARSELERTVRAAIQRAGLPEPAANLWVDLHDGSHVQIDLAWPELMVALEVDHPFWHDREAESARDKRRDLKLAALGWLPQRLSQVAVEKRLDESMADLREVLILRGWVPEAA